MTRTADLFDNIVDSVFPHEMQESIFAVDNHDSAFCRDGIYKVCALPSESAACFKRE